MRTQANRWAGAHRITRTSERRSPEHTASRGRVSDPESASKTTEASAQLKVYPNPNDGNFTVEYSCVEGSSARLVLVTLTGERIHLADNLKGTGREEFSISGASGLYQVVLESHKGRVLKNMKVIVAR